IDAAGAGLQILPGRLAGKIGSGDHDALDRLLSERLLIDLVGKYGGVGRCRAAGSERKQSAQAEHEFYSEHNGLLNNEQVPAEGQSWPEVCQTPVGMYHSAARWTRGDILAALAGRSGIV